MLLEQKYGMRKEKTAYGCSLSVDDVSTRPGGLLQQLLQQWGGDIFFLGGLGGVPFVGKTGFEAFLARVPEGGDAMVIFGPHMGMLSTGEMGKYLCTGKTEPVPACRAFVTAWQQCLAQRGSDVPDSDPLDMQQAWLRSRLASHSEDIAKANAPMAALAYQAYDLVAENLYAVLDANPAVGRLALLGGVQVSMPDGFEDHFLPIDFEVLQEGQGPKDHLDVFNKW